MIRLMNGSRTLTQWLVQQHKLLVALLTMTLFSGCGVVNHMIYKTTGNVMQGFAKDHTVPHLLETEDLVMGCAMSEATAPLLMSFSRVSKDPDQLAVMLYLTGGACAEERAREQELRGIAALRALNANEAEDATIMQRRHYALAAKRYFDAWQHHNKFYGHPDAGECPRFRRDMDELIYLAGLLAGLQALNAEIQSTTSVGTPRNIGTVVARATSCLDNEKWWGVPMSLRATVWAMIPGALPAGEDAFERLEASDLIGEQAGVRLSHVFHAIAAINKGDEARVRDVLRRHAEAIDSKDAAPEWRFLDRMATANLEFISDRLWMENTGHRTPVGRLGRFWDDRAQEVETMDLDFL